MYRWKIFFYKMLIKSKVNFKITICMYIYIFVQISDLDSSFVNMQRVNFRTILLYSISLMFSKTSRL